MQFLRKCQLPCHSASRLRIRRVPLLTPKNVRKMHWLEHKIPLQSSACYVASRWIDLLLKKDIFDMICILKIYQRANNVHCCHLICAERSVSNLEGEALFFRVKGFSKCLMRCKKFYFCYIFVVWLALKYPWCLSKMIFIISPIANYFTIMNIDECIMT